MRIPKHYKLIQDHPNSYEIGDSRDGKTFHIAKNGLDLDSHAQISKIQKFDEGGVVNSSSIQDSPEQIVADLPAEQPLAAPAPDQTSPESQRSPAAQTPLDPFSQQAQTANQALSSERQAIQSGASAESAEGAQNAQALKDYAAKLEQTLTPQQILDNHQKTDNDLMQQYMSKKIDPDHYWKNQNTGQKISSALAMIIGGAGARGGTNYALQSINNAINTDIDAQKSDQSKSLNLWKMNHEATQDQIQANLATQNQLLTGVKAKAMQYAAQAAGPEAKAKIAPVLAGIDQQIAGNNFHRMLLSNTDSNGVVQADPNTLVPSMVPESHQKQVFQELSQAKAANQNEDAIRQAFFQAAKETRPATGLSGTSLLNTIPGYQPVSIKNLQLYGDPLIHDNEGRVNEFEKADFNKNLPQWGDSDETVNKKWVAMQNFINHKKQAPTAAAFGLNPERFASTSSNPVARLNPQQQQYVQWAQQNPNDPRSKLVLQKLGIQ